tara:strand:- start:2507 stop:3214 length:708 start_codon:yes stop_codon:yes gene_type:complete
MEAEASIFTDQAKYPIDFITYTKDGQLPPFQDKVLRDVRDKGFDILPLTPDDYKVVKAGTKKADIPEGFIGSWHAGFKHLRDITAPKLMDLASKDSNIEGFLIAEADLCMNNDFNFDKFMKIKTAQPMWIGWKKINVIKGKIDYIVGNFLVYIPRGKLEEFNAKLQKKKQLVYSDRFYTNLVKEGFMKVYKPSQAGEIEHISEVAKGKVRRKSQAEEECHLNEEEFKSADKAKER